MTLGQTIESGAMRQMIRERDDAVRALEGRGVSVVVPCYEQQAYLSESLKSVFSQTVPPLEVIVVDDGSKIPVYYNPASHIDVPVRIIRVANRGLPSARNVGLMNARGHAFLPLDADDWLEPTYIEKTLPLLDAGADVVVTGLQEHGERTGRYRAGCELGLGKLTVEQERMSNRLFYCSLLRTSLLKEAGGYNGRMVHGYEDWDLWVDLMQRGAKLAAVDEPLFNYRTRKDSMLAQTEAQWKDWNWDEMARHHGYPRPQPVKAEKVDRQEDARARRDATVAAREARRIGRRG
jgi:cellulose synthase/poly-beta-1,6-N-acetylglucosamine synthase-like glycosyltransferase